MSKKLTQIAIKGRRGTRGKQLTTGKGWRLIEVSSNRQFVASILQLVRVGGQRLAIVRVWRETGWGKRKKRKAKI